MADYSKAREILVETPSGSLDGLENLVNQLFKRQDGDEFRSADDLYRFCLYEFPNCLALKLFQVYRTSSNRLVRFRSIHVLSETLTEFRNRGIELSLVTLYEMKPLLISCLTMEETGKAEIKLFRRIVSCVAYDVVMLDSGGWDELSECILFLTTEDPLKAFNLFVDLPVFYGNFISRFKNIFQEKAYEVLLNPEKYGIRDWSLALQSAVKMGIQLIETEFKPDLVNEILCNLVKAASELVEKGMEDFLVQGLENLESFLSQDKYLFNYNGDQCDFVKAFLVKIKGLGTDVEYAVGKTLGILETSYSPAIGVSSSLIQEQDDRALWYDHMNSLSPLELLGILASTDLDTRYREWAIKLLNALLSDHLGEKMKIDISVMRQLQPVLISCLKEEGISDSMFRIVCQVVNHVADEMVRFADGKWDGLRDYFASEGKRDFPRAVHVFQWLTMYLEEECLIQLLSEISTRLKSPKDSSWALAFTGAFCAIIKWIQIKQHGEYVKNTAHQMISSLKDLVERGMEEGFVRRALREMECIVKHQVVWYTSTEYKFVKGLLWSLREIKGMEMESKVVLWRINVCVEKGVNKLFKDLVNPEYDWLNQPLPERDDDLED